MKNSQLLEIPSGNTGFKIKYGSKMLTIMSGLKFIKQNFRSGISKKMKELGYHWMILLEKNLEKK